MKIAAPGWLWRHEVERLRPALSDFLISHRWFLRKDYGNMIARLLVLKTGLLFYFLSISHSAGDEDRPTSSGKVLIAPILPKPLYIDGQRARQELESMAPMFEGFRQRPTREFFAPVGTVNLAKGLKVASSCPQPIEGSFELITDENADSSDGCVAKLSPGAVWIQFDLKQPCRLEKLWAWHYHKNTYAARAVVIQLSDDPYFQAGVVTIFNNDHDNDLKLGAGSDPVYLETNHGRLFDAAGKKCRYVRMWSNGHYFGDDNYYTEVMIFGQPVALPK